VECNVAEVSFGPENALWNNCFAKWRSSVDVSAVSGVTYNVVYTSWNGFLMYAWIL